jgi:hypothetical protein
VRLAKHELAQMDAEAQSLSGKVRFATASGAVGNGSELPGLHDGFFDFAAAVVRPQPSARQYAVQLSSQLDDNLREIQAFGASGKANAPSNSGTLVSAERSQKEILACFDILETYVRDTTTDSKERDELLNRARKSAKNSLHKILLLIKAGCRDIDDAEENKVGLEASLAQLDEDNSGLRHVMNQMLATEGDLRAQIDEKESQVASLKQSLVEADKKAQTLNAQLAKATQDFEHLQEEHARGRPTTDQCVSPMMGFSAFMMSTDQVPAMNVDGAAGDGVPSWVRSEGLTNISGVKPEPVAEKTSRRKTVGTNQMGVLESQLFGHRHSQRLSMVLTTPAPSTRTSRRVSRSNATSPGADQEADGSRNSRSNTFNQSLVCTSNAPQSRSNSNGRVEDVVTPVDPPDQLDSPRSSRADSPDLDHQPEPSLLATSFPALLPFVDFHMLDPELSQSQADALALNSEHLEKHLVILQEDYQKEVARNEALQHSVDVCLERI